MNFKQYKSRGFYDELIDPEGNPRPGTHLLIKKLGSLSAAELKKRQTAAELELLNMGITFNVASEEEGSERIFPFDIIPRIVHAGDWRTIEKGLKQRIEALNLFLSDVYGAQKILKDKIIPRRIIDSGTAFRKECVGLKPPRNIWCHVSGSDVVRDQTGAYFVLEDNLRCPSGVSYVIENRLIMKRIFPAVFESSHVYPVDDYPSKLLDTLENIAPHPMSQKVVVLTPGVFNSAYFEHSFLAQQMGCPLVEGCDLVVKKDIVYMKTTRGLERVDVIYRRVDDLFLDPLVFNKDSTLGVAGLMKAYQKGNVALANAPGCGIADDKVVYKYVPEIIRYYLGQDPLLANVPTYLCINEKEKAYVLANMEKLVVKSANEAGGYGMLVGPASTAKERRAFAEKIKANPRNYLAQPTLSLSRAPTLVKGNRFEGRHVDLRPYILFGKKIYIMPGGLTRVALKKGSLVVNSSQGGGSKDTWVLMDGDTPHA